MVHIGAMTQVPVSEAKAQLTDLVRQAEAGDEVVLTRHGKPVARLSAIGPRTLSDDQRRRFLRDLQDAVQDRITPGPSAARSQDFLYDDDGLPG